MLKEVLSKLKDIKELLEARDSSPSSETFQTKLLELHAFVEEACSLPHQRPRRQRQAARGGAAPAGAAGCGATAGDSDGAGGGDATCGGHAASEGEQQQRQQQQQGTQRAGKQRAGKQRTERQKAARKARDQNSIVLKRLGTMCKAAKQQSGQEVALLQIGVTPSAAGAAYAFTPAMHPPSLKATLEGQTLGALVDTYGTEASVLEALRGVMAKSCASPVVLGVGELGQDGLAWDTGWS